MSSEANYMMRCLELAQRAKGNTAPNPMVGAVLVHQVRIIGEGWHHYYGADHAEVNCIKNVAEADRHLIPDSVMYVNLEPCAHYGLTPPCANRIVEEGIKEVHIANVDPFPKVSGRGIDILDAAGVTVLTGEEKNAGLWVNRRFFCTHTLQRPYVILKWAQTKDRFMAPVDRSRFQITGSESQVLVHCWRTEEGAILVGTTTAMNDNPQLTARLYEGKQPLRIAIDKDLKLPRTHHLFDDSAATWIINAHDESQIGNVHFIQCDFNQPVVPQLLQRLHTARILSLIVEGGEALLQSFIAPGLWDEARVFTGDVTLQSGVPSPLLPVGIPELSALYGKDLLQLYVNPKSAYPFVYGLDV